MSHGKFLLLAGALLAGYLIIKKAAPGSPGTPSSPAANSPQASTNTAQGSDPYQQQQLALTPTSGTAYTVATGAGTFTGHIYTGNVPGFTGSLVSPYGGSVPSPINNNQLGYSKNGIWSPYPF